MPEATFYTHVAHLDAFLPRLIQRILEAQKQLLIWVDTDQEAQTINQLLWQYQPESFIPHELLPNHQPYPSSPDILIGSGSLLPERPSEIVVLNLAPIYWLDAQPAPQRILEIIGSSEAELAAARERFQAYRRAGYTLTHHKMG